MKKFLILFFTLMLILVGIWGIKEWNITNKPAKVSDEYIIVDGLERTYRTYFPKGYDKSKKYPLLLALHCACLNNIEFERLSKFDVLSNQKQVIVVYPQALRKMWQEKEQKNIHFISELIDHLEHSLNIDKKRVYITGNSSGAGMTYDFIKKFPHKVTVAAIISASYGKPNLKIDNKGNSNNNLRSNPIPILFFNGLDDQTLPLIKNERGKLVRNSSVITNRVSSLVKKYKCSAKPEISVLNPSISPGRYKIYKEKYLGCKNNADIVFYKIIDGPHYCLNSIRKQGKSKAILSPEKLSQIIWDFFEKHSK